MNTTYALEFCLAVNLSVVIRGQKRARATIVDMNTKIEVKSKVIAAWNRCQPSQQLMFGKLVMTCCPFPGSSHCTTDSKVSVMGRKNTVTNKGTICARNTRGNVKRNFFLLNEQLTYMMSTSTKMITMISEYSINKNAVKVTFGRYEDTLNRPKIPLMLFKVTPPFQAPITAVLKGKAIICRQSSPLSKMSPKIVSSSSSDCLSSSTNSTLKIESFRSFQAVSIVFYSYNPISVFIFDWSSII